MKNFFAKKEESNLRIKCKKEFLCNAFICRKKDDLKFIRP